MQSFIICAFEPFTASRCAGVDALAGLLPSVGGVSDELLWVAARCDGLDAALGSLGLGDGVGVWAKPTDAHSTVTTAVTM